jgi:Uma2 family endonuclease
MAELDLSLLEDLDVEDLISLPKGFRYELHSGNLVIMTPSTFWHEDTTRRLLLMLHAAGLNAYQDPGVRGDRPRDCRLPDFGVLVGPLPRGKLTYSNLPGSAYRILIEVVSRNSENGEYTYKANWFASCGVPEYWIVDETSDHDEDDAVVMMHRLALSGGAPAYVRERTVLLSELEIEYRSKQA